MPQSLPSSVPTTNTGTALSSALQKANEAASKQAVQQSTNPTLANALVNTPIPHEDKTKTNSFKVKLTAQPRYGASGLNSITFETMPSIGESRSASFASFTPSQHPGEILKYQGTSSRSWRLQFKIVSRTSKEASENLKKLNVIRSWMMPFYGNGTGNNQNTKQYLGAPPPIITLSAYGAGAIGPLPCVIDNYNFDWPWDVDYIQTEESTPFPVLSSLTVDLKETYSPSEYSGFDLEAFRRGDVTGAFTKAVFSQPKAASTATVGKLKSDQASVLNTKGPQNYLDRVLDDPKNILQSTTNYVNNLPKTASGIKTKEANIQQKVTGQANPTNMGIGQFPTNF